MVASQTPGPSEARAAKDPAEAAALAEEARVGGSDRGRRANLALLALSRAARSFLLYDPGNDAIRRFIEDLRTRMVQALAGAETLRFEVRPFELVLDGEVVYLERDREHSLAFRMYRDGVRRLIVSGGTDWDEMLRLLEILSIRYTGVRQNEDDIVTLLWKAGFKHIEIEAVEGFVPEDEEGPTVRRGGAHDIAAPDDWDMPARALAAPAPLQWRNLPAEALETVRSEEASHLLAANATQAASALLGRATDANGVIAVEDLLPFVAEVRDFLLAEGQLANLTLLVRVLQANAALDPERIGQLVLTFGDRRALGHILHSTPKSVTAPPAELIELLDLLPTERLARLIDTLSSERGEAARRLTRQLIERYAREEPDYVVARLRHAEPGVACDLLRALAGALPERAEQVAVELLQHPDASVASEALRRLEQAAPHPHVARALVHALDSPDDEMRARVLELLAGRYGAGVFEPLTHVIERRAVELELAEAEQMGRALARVGPPSVLELFKGWLRRRGLVGRLVESRREGTLEWVAVAGLGARPEPEAEALIREVMARAGADLRHHCLATLARRRHEGIGRG